METDVLIIGGGIIGLSVAYQLKRKGIYKDITVIDKEKKIATHQTEHNSGVIHAGVYYTPGSLKAKLCKEGLEDTIRFCKKYNIKYESIGKLLVATNEREHKKMLSLYERALENNIDIRKLSKEEVNKLEPNINCVSALYSPKTSITNFKTIAGKLAEIFIKDGGKILLSEEIVSGKETFDKVHVITNKRKIAAKKVICCAGLFSDRVVKKFFQKPDFRIVPFRGEFFEVKNHKNLINHLIYPIPDPLRPFLGVHITKKVSGAYTVGPNAVLAFKREGYSLKQISIRDLFETITYIGFLKMLSKNIGPAISEIKSSISKSSYLKNINKYCQKIDGNDLYKYPAGVRAQAISADGKIIDDFKFIHTKRILHVCNAPSPAATAALPIGRYIIDKLEGK